MLGRVNGMKITEIARRTVPCYKYVLEPDGERLALCLLVDSRRLYRYPYEDADLNESVRGTRGMLIKSRYLKGEMERFRLREFQPGYCRYVNSPPA